MKPITETDLEQLSAYIDGELSDSERRFFQKRLSSDVELRAYCERVWIASSVLKSQPLQILPNNCADIIGSQCQQKRSFVFTPMRLVASLGALAVVVGIGIQLMKPIDMSNSVVQTNTLPEITAPALVVQSPVTVKSTKNIVDINPKSTAQIADNLSEPIVDNSQLVAYTDPSQFELNESTRSKSWPRSNQGMDDYLVRHNQMVDANSSNGLISYAQILTNDQSTTQEQGDK